MTRRRFEHANNPNFECAESVILLPFGRRSYLPAIVDVLEGEEITLDETTDRQVFALRGGATDLTLLYSGMGSPAAANAIEMAAAAGARRVVVFGACGGVTPSIGIGDLVVASGAVRGEGTSRYYAPPGFPAACDPVLTARMWKSAHATGHPAHLGVVFTTDAGYRQGPEIYENHAGLVIAVESECAAAAVVGARLSLEIGAVFFCTDNVTHPDKEDRGYRGLSDEHVRCGFDVGLEVVVASLSQVET